MNDQLLTESVTLPAAGWTDHRYLVLTMEVAEDHSMAFNLLLYAEEEAPRMTIRFGLLPHFPTRVIIDLNWLDGHILYPGHRVGTQKVVCHGSRIRCEELRRAVLAPLACSHPAHFRLTEVSFTNEVPEPLPLPQEKLVDALGQLATRDWPGKTHSMEDLRAFLEKEAAAPAAYPWTATRWGGFRERKLKDGTGWFSSVKKDGRWYLCDPEGCAFYSMGPDGVILRKDDRVDGLESLLTWIPGEGEPGWEDMLVEDRPFSETPRTAPHLFSYSRANLRRVFGDQWEEAWKRMIVSQLQRHGMNTIANWSDPGVLGSMPYVWMLPEFPRTEHMIFRDFPDVFAPEYEQSAEAMAQPLAEHANDPMMIGYFLRNEPGWAFVDGLIIADEVLRDPVCTCSKRALIGALRQQYGEISALNQAWGTAFSDFDDLLAPIEKASALSESAKNDLRAFSRMMLRRYIELPAKACCRIAPHHLMLGMRWAWISDPDIITGWELCDVFSINCYAVDPTPMLEQVRTLGVDRPVMIGEFHFGATDAGLTATGLEAVTNQQERGAAYRCYVEHAAAHPLSVGCHYFQCYDQFCLGRFDGENYNIGLFDVCLRPYEPMLEAVKTAAVRAAALHAGEIQPTERKPESIPMIAY